MSHTCPPYPQRWAVLAVVLLAEVMDLLDATITGVAAPAIAADLGGGRETAQWLGAAYTLPFAVLLITAGRLGDRYGRRPLFLIGAAGFTLASVLCALAPGPGALIAARALQGACGALLLPQGFGIVKETFPEPELGKAFGLFGPVMGLCAVGGPVVGGLLAGTDLFGAGWRMVFLVNLPLGLAALAARSGGSRAARPTPACGSTYRACCWPGRLPGRSCIPWSRAGNWAGRSGGSPSSQQDRSVSCSSRACSTDGPRRS